jgi:hypothetical protein
VVLVVLAIGWFERGVASVKQTELEKIKAQVEPLLAKEQTLHNALAARDRQKKEADQMMGLVDDRFYWGGVLTGLRQIFIQAEEVAKQKLTTDVGLWVEMFSPDLPAGGAYSAPAPQQQGSFGVGVDPMFEARYGNAMRNPEMMAQTQPQAGTTSANEISTITMLCRGVNLDRISPTANKDLAYTLEEQIKKSPLFVEGTTLGDIVIEPTAPLTFTFKLTVKLKRPFKL